MSLMESRIFDSSNLIRFGPHLGVFVREPHKRPSTNCSFLKIGSFILQKVADLESTGKMTRILTNLFLEFLLANLVVNVSAGNVEKPTENFSGASSAFPNLRKIIIETKSISSSDIQHAAVEALVKRLLNPSEAARFLFEVSPNAFDDAAVDTAKITSNGNTVRIVGNSGTACSFALYHFLKYQCGCQVAWSGRQLTLPDVFPTISQLIKKADWLHYYQNVCTVSYSSVWWNWTRWEEEIDWMALQGINFPLAFTGQEEIWRRVYSKLGLTDIDMEGFFVGPAFLAWGRMGNIRRWAGPLSRHWLNSQVELQHKILDRMNSLGIIPVLPGFGGIVPEALQKVYPEGNFSRVESWSNFPENMTRSYLLAPTDPMYTKLGKEFIQEMQAEFGIVTHFYNADSFNEQKPNTSSTDFVKAIANATYSGMIEADEDAIWVMQGWLFVYDPDYWTQDLIKALLTAVPSGKMILLDLDADSFPVYASTQSFYGQPFIWCMLHNYGGVQGLYGRISVINREPILARNSNGSTMIGVGLSPEGINQNEVIYEFMNEMSWRTESTDLDMWFGNFSTRRYGAVNKDAQRAFQVLRKSVFDNPTTWANQGRYSLTRRPRLDLEEPMWYDALDVYSALKHLLDASINLPETEMLSYDIVDVGRQSLQIAFRNAYEKFQFAVKEQNLAKTALAGKSMTSILTDMNYLLSTQRQFSLDDWVSSAKFWASNSDEEKLFVENSLNQITIWGPNANILDYATKQWSGVVSRYYRPRWKLFVHRILESIKNSTPFDQGAFEREVLEKVERPFTLRRYLPDRLNSRPDPIKVASRLFEKYQNLTFYSD